MNISDNLSKLGLRGKFSVKMIDKATGEVVDSFEEANAIVLKSKDAIIKAIGGSSDGVISGLKIGDDTGEQVTMAGTPNLTFADVNPDTITRDAGSWIDDGFLDSMILSVTGTTNNNTTYTIATVDSATVLTLIPTDGVIAETSTATVTGIPGLDNPSPALTSYDQNTMGADFVYEHTGTITPNYASQKVTFGLTIDGSDVMSNYPSESSVVFCSSSLHSTDGEVFAYKRFPQKSISALIDISISWEISYP